MLGRDHAIRAALLDRDHLGGVGLMRDQPSPVLIVLMLVAVAWLVMYGAYRLVFG